MKATKTFFCFLCFAAVLTLFAACSNSSSPVIVQPSDSSQEQDSTPTPTPVPVPDQTPVVASGVEIEWEPFLAVFEASLSGKAADAESLASSDSTSYSAVYTWQIADSESAETWTTVNWTEEPYFYEPNQADIGKYLRVKVDWKHEGQVQDALYSKVEKIVNRLDLSGLSYNGDQYVDEGSVVDSSKVEGGVTDIIGSTIESYSITACNPSERLYFSDYVYFEISCEGYPTEEAPLFVPVKGVLKASDIPLLSTDSAYIPKGCVKFISPANDLEYSLDNGESYSPLTADAFSDGTVDGFEEDEIIKIRKKAVGVVYDYDEDGFVELDDEGNVIGSLTEVEIGYRKESDPIEIFVVRQNIGTSEEASAGISISFKNIQLKLEKQKFNVTAENGDTIAYWSIFADVSNTEAFEILYGARISYTWIVDGLEVESNTPGDEMYFAGDGQTLILDTSQLPEDVVQVECRISFIVYTDDDISFGVDGIAPLSEQISVDLTE